MVEALAEVAGWLGGTPVPALPPVPVREAVTAWAAPRMIDVWNTGFALELVRFAGRNRLCLELAYGGTTRLVEPYSLGRSQAGHLLFGAPCQGGEGSLTAPGTAASASCSRASTPIVFHTSDRISEAIGERSPTRYRRARPIRSEARIGRPSRR